MKGKVAVLTERIDHPKGLRRELRRWLTEEGRNEERRRAEVPAPPLF